MMVVNVVFIIVTLGVCNAITSSMHKNKISSLSMKSSPLSTFPKTLLSIGSGFLISTSTLTWDHPFIEYANADSTGKFSSKMTARKRYLPRIIEQVREFNLVVDKKESLDKFIDKENIDKFKRALNLYGASLRKGEVPDEISRTAESKTTIFIEKVLKSKNTDDMALCRKDLDDYLLYCKLELSASDVYK